MEIISQFPLQAKTFYCNKIHLKKKQTKISATPKYTLLYLEKTIYTLFKTAATDHISFPLFSSFFFYLNTNKSGMAVSL